MTPQRCLALGALWAAVAVTLGAFGAHALEERLRGVDQLGNWETAVRYQMWHALALLCVGILGERRSVPAFVGWAFLVGSLLFSGSIYLLALELGKSFVWPLTPLGGALLIAGWITLAISAFRSPST